MQKQAEAVSASLNVNKIKSSIPIGRPPVSEGLCIVIIRNKIKEYFKNIV
jgi:hypothetical protein